MEKFKGCKCEYGYIDKQKKFQLFMILIFAAVGVGIFLVGYLTTGTRANVFTVLGILMVLPGAKRVIALVVMLPRHSVTKERYEQMKQFVSEQGVLLTDYVFTSTDKIMNMDFVVVENQNVFGILGANKQDKAYILQYLQKAVDGIAPGYQVRLFTSEQEFIACYQKMKDKLTELEEQETLENKQEEIVKYLKILAV